MTAPRDQDRPALRPAVVGVGALAVIAIAILAIVLIRPDDGATGEASPTASPPGSTSIQPSGSAQPSGSSAPLPSPSASSSPPTGIPEGWAAVATYSESGKRYLLGGLSAWSGGLIGVGTLWEEEGRSVFGPPPPRAGRVWASVDGTAWTDATPSGTFADVELTNVYEAADGALVVIGDTWPGLDVASAAWESTDGETWQPMTLEGIPPGSWVPQVVHGAQGWLAVVATASNWQAFHSTDGRSWVPTLEDAGGGGAGDEGFVGVTLRDEDGAQIAGMSASSDGINWFDAAAPAGDAFVVAPRASDWLAVSSDYGEEQFTAAAWQSANGLDWTKVSDVPLADVDVGGGTTCGEAPGHLHPAGPLVVLGMTLLGPCSEGGVIGAGGSYASIDGTAWTRLPFGDSATAVGAAMAGDRIVVATDTRTNQAPTIGVTFWISNR